LQAHGDKTVNCVVFSPNGEQILTGAYDMTAKIFNVGNGKEMQCIDGFKGPVLSATFTVDSSCVVAGSSKGQLVVIDASNGKVLQRIEHAHAGKINSVTASADGKLLATAGSDKCAKVWHVGASGQWALIKTLKMAEEVTCVAWSPDQLLLAASSTDSTVRVYHASDGWNELARIKGHTDEVNGVSIINKGNRTLLATASDDKQALIFDISAICVQLKVAAAKSGKAVCQITAGLPDGAETAPVSVGDPADMEGLD
jgi:WD40 repeat protein